MKKEYDFSNAKRGPVIPSPGTTKIAFLIDNDVLEWFLAQIEKACGGSFQTMINDTLRLHIESRGGHVRHKTRKPVSRKKPR